MKTKPAKRGPGRPRKSPAPTGASLREAAAALGVTRSRLLKMIDEGLPSARHNERRYVDVAAAQAWMDARAEVPPVVPMAKSYFSSDPRYRLSVATGAIREIEFAIEQGRFITLEKAGERLTEDLTELGGRLKSIDAQCEPATMTPADIAAALVPIIDDVVSDFHFGDPATWPQPIGYQSDASADDGSEFETPDYVPVLPSNDPRARDATVKAIKAEAHLKQLQESTIDIRDWLLIAERLADGIRETVRMLPSLVADSVHDDVSAEALRSEISDKVELIKILVRGPTPEEIGADDVAMLCDGKPFPSVVQRAFDCVYVEGDDELGEPRPSADLEPVLAALEMYPQIRVAPEFG